MMGRMLKDQTKQATGIKYAAVYVCRGCGMANPVTKDVPPAKCRNTKCKGAPDPNNAWSRLRDDPAEPEAVAAPAPGSQIVTPPPQGQLYPGYILNLPDGKSLVWDGNAFRPIESLPGNPVSASPAPENTDPKPEETFTGVPLLRDAFPEDTPQTDTQYRSSWVGDIVQSYSMRDLGVTPADVWTAAEKIYDEGKRRGHLP